MLDNHLPLRKTPQRRVLLLGASNLVRGISPIVHVARHVWGQPLDIMAALGHGRSYGLTETRVLVRTLPGILRCGLWKSLRDRPQVPTATLLTDIGNDLLYDVPVARITEWVRETMIRCHEISERIVITELPLMSLTKMARWQFLFLRTVFFPASRLRFDEGLRRAEQLNQQVVQLAEQFGATVVRPCATWYGFDPIHIRKGACSEAWHTVLSSWRDEEIERKDQRSLRRWLYLRCLRPEQRRLFSFWQYQSQPVGRLRDGTRISFY